jgi:hypothetical protein
MAQQNKNNRAASSELSLSDDFKELSNFDASIFNLCVSTKGYIIQDVTDTNMHLYASGGGSKN